MTPAIQSLRVVKGGRKVRSAKTLEAESFRYLPSPVHFGKAVTQFAPPRLIEFDGFASAEEKQGWDAISDEAWTNLDSAE